jgi:hypothetical protein
MAAGLGEGFGKGMEGVAKDIEGAIPTSIDLPVPTGTADISYNVSPVVEGFTPPGVSSISYGVKPVVEGFTPPDVSNASYGLSSASASDAGVTAPSTFAPVINLTVNGGMDDGTTEDLSNSLYDTVRRLFDEFREQELEHMALKNQYAF